MLRVTVHDTVHDIDASEWNEVVDEGRLFQTHGWLALLEAGALVDCPPKYIVFRTEDGRIAAHVTAYMIQTSLVIFSKGPLRALVNSIRSVFSNFLMTRVLECGCPLGASNSVSLRKGVQFVDIVTLLNGTLEEIAAANGIRLIVVRDFLEEDIPPFSMLERFGYTRVGNLPTALLDVHWDSFAGYLAAMNSRHRYAVRKRLRHCHDDNITVDVLDDFAHLSQQLARQLREVDAHAGEYSRVVLTCAFYKGVAAASGDRFRLLAISQENRLIAHALLVRDGPQLRWLLFGREKGGVRDGAYFAAIARIVDIAVTEGLQLVDMGLTTYRVKMDFGARMVPLWMYVHIRSRLFGKVALQVLRLMNPGPELVIREIFKPASGVGQPYL
jgi:predicted N-acyltransferase